MPPILLIHGTADAQVPYDQSVEMRKKLKSLGVPCDLFTVPNGAHGMGSWEKLPSQEWKSYLASWLRNTLR
jgi:dipeptidyl aminopeptidase/acylaminoacyl peptidase